MHIERVESLEFRLAYLDLLERHYGEMIAVSGMDLLSKEWRTTQEVALERSAASNRHVFLLALDDELVPTGLGAAFLRADATLLNPITGVINEVYVVPTRRRLGIATAIARHLMEWLEGGGASRLELRTPIGGEFAGAAFWRSLGFSEQALVMGRRP